MRNMGAQARGPRASRFRRSAVFCTNGHNRSGRLSFFRISFATSMETLEEGCTRLARACAALAS
jgi:bifunctional pyridoxal-dependent enzyme with beta-cystathionase and maltose regulon repressor activities